jgi:hypothetical protein
MLEQPVSEVLNKSNAVGIIIKDRMRCFMSKAFQWLG